MRVFLGIQILLWCTLLSSMILTQASPFGYVPQLHRGRQGRDMDPSYVSISGTLLVTLPHTLQLPTAPKQQAIRACSTFSLGQKGKSWGLRCPHHDNTVTLGLNLERGSGSHHWALSSQVLFAAISHQKNKKRGSERTGYGIYSPVLILSARNIKHKANEFG